MEEGCGLGRTASGTFVAAGKALHRSATTSGVLEETSVKFSRQRTNDTRIAPPPAMYIRYPKPDLTIMTGGESIFGK